MNKISVVQALVLVFFVSTAVAQAASPDKQKELDELMALPSFASRAGKIVEANATNLIMRDPRILAVDKKRLVKALTESVPVSHVSDEYKFLLNQNFTPDEIDYLLKLKKSSFSNKMEAAVPLVMNQLGGFTIALLKANFQAVTHLPYEENPTPTPTPSIGAPPTIKGSPRTLVRWMWKLFPDLYACPAN